MTTAVDQLMTGRILVVDDERYVHASLRLRLAGKYDLVSCSEPRAALGRVEEEDFDLCIVDLHMPGMTGLEFVEEARLIDAGLGFVFLSGHATEENLRKAIPLQVYDFVCKPLPDRAGFEARVPDWISRTRERRQELALLESSRSLAQRLDVAQIERDIEFTASESARDALLQSANLLTTIQALLTASCSALNNHAQDARFRPVVRSLQEARKAAEAATAVTEGFFNSAYANRDTSPALLGTCLEHAVAICLRWTRAEEDRKTMDTVVQERNAVISGLSGIELLLMLISALGIAVEIAPPGTTITVRSEGLERLDAGPKTLNTREFLWVNRRNSLHTQAGISLRIRSSATAWSHLQIKSWLEGGEAPQVRSPARGLLHGLIKCKGMLGLSVAPAHSGFELVLVVPT